MNYTTASRRTVKALTGQSVGELKKLAAGFAESLRLLNIKNGVGKNPKRPGRPPGQAPQDILIFVLAYLKTNMTFDVLAILFNVSRSTYHRLTKLGLSALEHALDEAKHLPARDYDSVLKFLVDLKGQKQICIDATERRIRRPKKNQKHFYSGKKKCHTVKNQIISDKSKRVICVSQTVEGRIHDFKLFKQQNLANNFPKRTKCLVDSAYQGIAKTCPGANFRISVKKPKGSELTQKQKNSNRKISSARVTVEHAIGGTKRMQAVGEKCRSIRLGLRDQKFLVSAGLWNFHIAG